MESEELRAKGREDSDSTGGLTITIMPDGTVVLPAGLELTAELAKSLGDSKAAQKGVAATKAEVLFGERMCG